VGGLINGFKEHKSKKGERMGFLTLEDIVGAVEIVIFPEVFSQCSHLVTSNEPIIVQGMVKKDERGGKIIADAVDSLNTARNKYTDSARIHLPANRLNRTKFDALKEILLNFHGSCPVLLTLHFEGRGEVDIEIQKDLAIQPGSQFTMEVNKFLGEKAVSYQMKPMEAKERKKKNGFWAKGKKGGHHQN
jgi:DNA polymerase-3 subunit alpha